jgi:hypothetical protein
LIGAKGGLTMAIVILSALSSPCEPPGSSAAKLFAGTNSVKSSPPAFGISRDTLYRYVPVKKHRGSLQNEMYAGNRRRKTMSESEMQAELERLRAENAQLKSKDKGGLTLKVSEKGGLSLYGMGRFPVTLYKEQWLRILASASEIEAFIRENDSKLKTKE